MLSVGDALLMVYQSYIHVIFILGWSFATYQSFVNGFQMEIKSQHEILLEELSTAIFSDVRIYFFNRTKPSRTTIKTC